LMTHPYFDLPAPKSLDRDAFEPAGVSGLTPADGAATLVAFTAAAVGRARDSLPARPQRWLVTGGGRHNPVLMSALRTALGVPVEPVESVGWDGDAVEAQAFAYLAVRSLAGLPLSLPMTTGGPRPMDGGRLDRAAAQPARLNYPLARCCFRIALGRRGRGGQDARQIFVDHILQLIQVIAEEVVGALDDLVVDLDIALVAQLRHQFGDRFMGHDVVAVALHHQARGRAGGKEAEVVDIAGGSHADEAGDLRPAHQKLHPDPRAEGKS